VAAKVVAGKKKSKCITMKQLKQHHKNTVHLFTHLLFTAFFPKTSLSSKRKSILN